MDIQLILIISKLRVKSFWIFFTCLILVFSLQISAETRPVLVFNVTGQPPLNTITHDGFMDEVTREALKRINYRLFIDRLPAERGLRYINAGVIDGEMSRIFGMERLYPNMVRVPEKIMDWEFVVFSKEPLDLQKGWASLVNIEVAFITGWKILEKNVPETALVTKVKDAQQLFDLLVRDRTDVIIYERWGGISLINKLDINNIKPQKNALATREMFIYLNKKHQSLAPKLAQVLVDMKRDGSYATLVEKHLLSVQKHK